MDHHELWDRYRSLLYDDAGLGVRLDVSRMDLPGDAMERFAAPMARAFDAMDRLERGVIANPDEERMVGHYWLRAPERAPSAEERRAIEDTRESVVRFAQDVHAGKIGPPGADSFRRLLVIGIGGSALGPQFVSDALGTAADPLRPSFIDNCDPDGIDRVLAGLGEDLVRTLTVVISKSGGTPETKNGMIETERAYRDRGLDFGAHAVAITQQGSQLDRHADANGFLARFPMWDWVGGRTSETSAVGMLPAALQGLDVGELLAGAAAMDAATRVREIGGNPAAILAMAWHHAGDGRGRKDMVILPYKDRLALFGRYLQQLVMESLGKELDLDGNVVHQGIAVYGNKGSTDQHAYVQQLREGVPNFFVTFVEVLQDREGSSLEVEEGITSGDYLHGFLLGTRLALHDAGRPSITLTLPDMSPRTIGMLIALYERAVGLYATLVNVNAYHQPGVEAGKKAAAAVLDLQRRLVAALAAHGKAGGTCEQLAEAIDAGDEVETVFHLLEHLAANPGRRVERIPGETTFDAIYRSI